jgi:RNA polymerase sigma-70 factor (ECF subfamily)
MTDKETLVAFSEGDAKAFEMIYNRFYTNVFFIAKGFIKSEEDAKDIRANCFIKLWEQREKLNFESMGGIFTWLRTIAANECMDYIRRVNIRIKREERVINTFLSYNEREVIFEISDKEAIILDRLFKKIEQLSPRHKEIFEMRWLYDLRFTEIAKKLHTDVSTIKKRYARALILLKK